MGRPEKILPITLRSLWFNEVNSGLRHCVESSCESFFFVLLLEGIVSIMRQRRMERGNIFHYFYRKLLRALEGSNSIMTSYYDYLLTIMIEARRFPHGRNPGIFVSWRLWYGANARPKSSKSSLLRQVPSPEFEEFSRVIFHASRGRRPYRWMCK